METPQNARKAILENLDLGEISVEDAVSQLEAIAHGQIEDSIHPQSKEDATPTCRWEGWWMVPFTVGLVFTAAGGLVGGLLEWWILAGFLGLIGIPLMILSALSQRSSWVHIRVRGKEGMRPRRIAISLPLPLGLTAMILRFLGDRIPGLRQTGVDELLLALDSYRADGMPIHVEVQDRDGMESVEVYLG